MRYRSVVLGVSTALAVATLSTTWGCNDSPTQPVPHVAATIAIQASVDQVNTGATVEFGAKVTCRHGYVMGLPVAWSVDDEEIATITSSGVLTGLTVGDVTVSATSGDVTRTMIFHVVASVALVEVEPSEASLHIGETVQLVPTLFDGEGAEIQRTIAWTTSDEDVATVDADGLVTAVAAGDAGIMAMSEGVLGEAAIAVLAPVAAVTVSPEAATLKPGETVQLAATLEDADGEALDRPVTWASGDESLATVDENGLVTAVAVGEVEITASAEGVSASAAVSVVPPVDRVEVSPDPVLLLPGGDQLLVATVFDADGNELIRPLEWSTDDPGIATVDENGLLSAVAVGRTTVSATSEGVTGEASVNVRVPVNRVVMSDPGMEPLEIGLTKQLEATVYDAEGNLLDREVTWSSSDEDIATVDEFGLVTGAGRGTVVITATSEGKSASAEIRVVGESSEAGNNLSYPVVFAEGIGLSGAAVSDATGNPVYANTGLRPGDAEGITVDALPFFHEGNVPDFGAYYEQQGANVWQAEWADGTLLESRSAEAAWGDNLTHVTWDTHQMIRVEVVLSDLGIGTLDGYNMTYLYGSGPDEMQGTDGSVGAFVPTIYAVTPRLIIEKLDEAGETVVEEVFNGAVWEGGEDGPGNFSAEVNVGGKIVYGFNFFIRNIELTTEGHKFGWWRLTFSLDEQATVGGETVMRNLRIDSVAGEGDPELTYQPVRAADGWSTSLDIYVEKASNH